MMSTYSYDKKIQMVSPRRPNGPAILISRGLEIKIQFQDTEIDGDYDFMCETDYTSDGTQLIQWNKNIDIVNKTVEFYLSEPETLELEVGTAYMTEIIYKTATTGWKLYAWGITAVCNSTLESRY